MGFDLQGRPLIGRVLDAQVIEIRPEFPLRSDSPWRVYAIGATGPNAKMPIGHKVFGVLGGTKLQAHQHALALTDPQGYQFEYVPPADMAHVGIDPRAPRLLPR